MNNQKNVQMPYKFMIDVYRLILNLEDYNLHEEDKSIAKDLEKQIEAKIDRMVMHDLYSKSKTALTDEERESARKEYLSQLGMSKDWRY